MYLKLMNATRLAIPVTARETQMLGRPEIFVGLNKMTVPQQDFMQTKIQ